VFKDDKMMTLLTGLVLAIFAGTMVQYGDDVISLLSGDSVESTEDDYFTALAGAEQKLDVLANDLVRGPLAITTIPACGSLRLGDSQTLVYQSDSTCAGEQTFTYCVVGGEGCIAHSVTISVVASSAKPVAVADAQGGVEVAATTLTSAVTATPTPRLVQPASVAATNTTSGTTQDSAPEVANAAPMMAALGDSAPEVDTVVIGVRTPMLASPQIGEFVAPNDAAAQLRSEATSFASSAAVNSAANVTVETSVAQMDTGFTAPTLGDEGVSLGRSVVVAGISFGNTEGLAVEDSASVAIAALETQATTGTFAPALNSNIAATDEAAEILEQGPTALENVSVLADINDISTSDQPLIDSGIEVVFSGTTTVADNALLPPSDTIGQAAEYAIELIDSFPAPAAMPSDNSDVVLNTANDATTIAAAAPSTARAADPGQLAPPTADTSTSSPLALVSSATTLLPSLDATPARPRLLMRHVALNAAPSALLSDSGTFSAPPSIDSSAAPAFQTASLTPQAGGQTQSVPGDTVCDIALDTLIQPGAEIELIVSAACRPNQMFNVVHAGLTFSAMTGDDGTASVRFPALEGTATIGVEFLDGAQTKTTAIVPDTELMLRSGISWRGDADLSINAYEFGATPDSPGHISPTSPRDYRAARILGGGFLVELGDVTAPDAAHAIVYSMPISRSTPEGIVTLTLRIDSPGRNCGAAAQITTFRSENAAAFSQAQNLDMGACDVAGPSNEYAGILDDLWTSAR